MQFEYTPPQTTVEEFLGGHRCINAIGIISPGDDVRFYDFLTTSGAPQRTDVYINSSGGDVESAIGIGRIVRDNWFSTNVGSYIIDHEGDDIGGLVKPRRFLEGACMSAATLIFLGGRLRYLTKDAQFGVHQFSFRSPSPENLSKSQILSSKIARYIADMGIVPEFLEISASVRSDEITLVDHDYLRNLRIVTDGITPVEWSVQSRNSTLYVRGERDTLWGHQKLIIGFVKPNFYLHAVIESQGRSDQLKTFPVVELVVGLNEDRIIDLSDRCIRAEMNMYTNVIATISAEEARELAFSEGFGVRVRGSLSAEMFLGISAMPTAGGEDLLQSFVKSLS